MKKFRFLTVLTALLLCGTAHAYAESFVFDDWTSTNHEHNSVDSKTYTFTLSRPSILSFDWSVSSEADCDPLIVNLNGTEVLRRGGMQSSSYTQELSEGEYTLELSYRKDGSVHGGDDQAIVSNIVVVVKNLYTDDNGVTWTYLCTDASAHITAVEGYTTELNVPATLPCGEQQLPVTVIECSFDNDPNIMSVDLSKTSITATPSFRDCPSLSSVLFPTTLKKISSHSFCSCGRLQSIDLSAIGITTIEDNAFRDCVGLSSVLFPTTLTHIGYEAFRYCLQLTQIDLSTTNLTTLESLTFSYCHNNLSEVKLPASLKKIDSNSFVECYGLSAINLSEVEEFGDRAFAYSSVSNADLSSAKVIGEQAFTNEWATYTINASTPASIKANSFSTNAKFIVTPDAYDTFCNALIWKNWANNISMYNVDADGVKWIYRYLKESNSMCITSASGYANNVTMPSSVSYNGNNVPVTHMENVFSGSNITSIILPEKLVELGNNAFSSCNALTSIEFPATLKAIGWHAFNDCDKLQKIDLSNTLVTEIQNHTFYSCNVLKEVLLPTTLTAIGEYAFYKCYGLASIEFPAALAAIGEYAFLDCDKLSKIDLSNTLITEIQNYTFYSCSYLKEITLPTTLTTIGERAFVDCQNIKDMALPASVKTIGDYAFASCHNINIDLSKVETIGDYAFSGINFSEVDLSSVTSVGYSAFEYAGGEPFFNVDNVNPAAIVSGAFPTNSMFLVPSSAVAAYQAANGWSDYASRIFSRDIAVQTINVAALANGSGVLEAIGGSVNQTKIIDLTVKGTINGYDFVMFKDKMLNLRFLDLSEAQVVYNPYRYYEYNYSQNDTLGAHAFDQENKLITIKLPKDIKHIGNNAFSGCSSLREVVVGDKLKSIGSHAFSSCSSLPSIDIPNTVTRIEYGTFEYCHNLKEFTFPNKLEYIGGNAFNGTQLKEVTFPTTLKTIDYGAFQNSSQLETVRIPSSLYYVHEGAFRYCGNLKSVYTYTIEPTDINENTFSNFETANLYVPKASGQNYYWDEGWKRFLNIWEFDEEYTYFYLNGDHTLDESTGAVDGTPEADLNPGSGLIVEEEVEQNMSDLNIHQNGNCGSSIIAGSTEGNISTDSLHVHINVQGGRWYFFCFPFDLKKENISFDDENTQYVFRCYDGTKRAEGNSGWKNVTEEKGKYLKAAEGYIFQCSQDDVLTISLANVKFKKEDKYNELVAHAAANMQDASWNFVGNPYLSYYDMEALGYDAPITVWNGYTYEAIKPGDDDYQLAPFEAFFVQKPEGTDAIKYDGDEQTTYRGAQKRAEAARARRRTQAINPERLLVNITISNGEKTDRTRIVFNNNAAMGYEMSCDAAKFEAAGVPQLYTLDGRAVKYAINERPVTEGIVTVGYTAPAAGNYTLAVPRMDTPIYIKDNLTGTMHDFSEGDYTFMTEAGTFEDRFTVVMKAGETGIDNAEIGNQNSEIHNVKGQRVEKMEQGIYIKNNRKVVNM